MNWEDKGLVSKVVVMGDFNIDMESHPKRVEYTLSNKADDTIDLNGHTNGHSSPKNGRLLVPNEEDDIEIVVSQSDVNIINELEVFFFILF